MSDKYQFTFLIRASERAWLRQLAKISDRSEGATLRYLIRQEAKRESLTTAPAPVAPQNGEVKDAANN